MPNRTHTSLSIRLASFLVLSIIAPSALQAGSPPPIFDGKTMNGWTTLDGKPVSHGWEVVDGMIHLKPSKPRAGHIVTTQKYGDFDLEFEWKVVLRANSGLKYRVRNYGKKVLGLEYQIYDSAGRTDRPRGRTGALYDLYEPNECRFVRPPGQFNHSRIIVCGNHIEHWLNGNRIVCAEVGSPEWQKRVGESKFSDNPHFGENRTGVIMLTDHGGEVWYRNLVLRPLCPTP